MITDEIDPEMSRSAAEERIEPAGRYRRVRWALVALLIILFILLLTILGFVTRLLVPAGAPSRSGQAEGLTWIRSIYGVSSADQFRDPAHVAVGPDGTIWVTDYQASRVLGFNPDGSFSHELTAGEADAEQGMLKWPLGVAADDDGNVYVASQATGTVIIWDAAGEIAQVLEVPGAIQVAVGEDRVFVTARDALYLFSREGERITQWSSQGSADDQIELPSGALVGVDGTLYIADTHNAQLKAFSADGSSVVWVNPSQSSRAGMVESPGELPEAEPSADSSDTDSDAESGSEESDQPELQIPMGLTMDSSGRLVLVDAFEFAIVTADAETGKLTGRYGAQGAADGQFNYPTSIDYDPDRDWYVVSDSANKRVQIVRLQGSGGSAIDRVRGTTLPWGLCAAPFILLILAFVAAIVRKRQQHSLEEEHMSTPTAH